MHMPIRAYLFRHHFTFEISTDLNSGLCLGNITYELGTYVLTADLKGRKKIIEAGKKRI